MSRPLVLGLAFLLLLCLFTRLDFAVLLGSFRHVGWSGFGLVLASGLALTGCLSTGLYPLLLGKGSAGLVFAARQVRDSAGDILPFTQIGGIALGMRVLTLGGVAPVHAVAAGIADVTTELLAQSLFILAGIGLAAPAIRADPHLGPYFGWLIAAALLFAAGIFVFALLQMAGSRLAERTFRPTSFGGNAALFREAIHILYRQRGRIALSVGLHFLAWCASGVWLWTVFYALGEPVPLLSAIAIQSLLEGLRSAMVFIPAAVGIQEAGYAALAPLFGLAPEAGLAASLLRRARDIVVGIPVLLIWQMVEARRAKRKS
jgi:putative membrane protein